MDKPFTQPAIRIEIPEATTLSPDATDGLFKTQEWQERCFNELRNSQHWIINAPMGSGTDAVQTPFGRHP